MIIGVNQTLSPSSRIHLLIIIKNVRLFSQYHHIFQPSFDDDFGTAWDSYSLCINSFEHEYGFLSSQQVVYEIITYFPVKIKHTVCFNFISNTYFYLFFLLCSILPKVSIAAFFNDLPEIKRVICCFCDFNDNLSPTMKCNILHQLETFLLLYTNTCFSVLERLNNNLLTILSPSIGQRMMKLRKNTGYIINQVFPNMGSLFDEYFLETLKLYSL